MLPDFFAKAKQSYAKLAQITKQIKAQEYATITSIITSSSTDPPTKTIVSSMREYVTYHKLEYCRSPEPNEHAMVDYVSSGLFKP